MSTAQGFKVHQGPFGYWYLSVNGMSVKAYATRKEADKANAAIAEMLDNEPTIEEEAALLLGLDPEECGA